MATAAWYRESMLGCPAHSVIAKKPQNTLESVKRLGRMKSVLRRFISSNSITLVVDAHKRQSLGGRRHSALAAIAPVEQTLHIGRRPFAEPDLGQRTDDDAHHVLQERVGLDLDGDQVLGAVDRQAGER